MPSESRHLQLFHGKMAIKETTTISSSSFYLLLASFILASVSLTTCTIITSSSSTATRAHRTVPLAAGPPNISRRHFSFATASITASTSTSTVPPPPPSSPATTTTGVLEASTTTRHFFEDEVEVTTKTNSQLVKTTSTIDSPTSTAHQLINSAAVKDPPATQIYPVSPATATKFASPSPTSASASPPISTASTTTRTSSSESKKSLTDEVKQHPSSVYSYVVSSSESRDKKLPPQAIEPIHLLGDGFEFYSLPYEKFRELELLCLSRFPGKENHFMVTDILQETCRINCTVLTTSHPIKDGGDIYYDTSELITHPRNEGIPCDARNPSFRCYDGTCADLSIGQGELRIINATISNENLGNVFDAYAKLYLDEKYVIKTIISRKTSTPIWNQAIRTPKIKKDALITIKVMDKHPSGDNELLLFSASVSSLIEKSSNGAEFCEALPVSSRICLAFKWISETN